MCRGAESESESESESPGVVAMRKVGVGIGVDQATSAPTSDRLLQFGLVRAGKKYFSVKFSGISPFSNCPSKHWRSGGLKRFR